MDPLPVFKGPVRAAGDPRARRAARPEARVLPRLPHLGTADHRPQGQLLLHQRPRLRRQHADLHAKVGQRVAFHVYGLDNFFHTFHLHGHRWTDPDGTIIDNKTFGPADSFRLEFIEDNPGRWFYHCHVFKHFHMGMNGWYIVA